MNHIFRSIWSEVLREWIAVSELGTTLGKSASATRNKAAITVDEQPMPVSAMKPLVLAVLCCFSLHTLAAATAPGPFKKNSSTNRDGKSEPAGMAAPGSLKTANSITVDGKTKTTITVKGQTTSITTATVSGTVAFNSFSTFNLGQGNTANLYLPQGSASLVNLVSSSQAIINGVLNSYKNGKIGGNVFFADPYGVVVGKSGLINVGSLAFSSPTQSFMSKLMDPNGLIDPASSAILLANAAPVSGNGIIDIFGKINAPDGVRLSANAVNVSGQITTGNAAVAQINAFQQIVNPGAANQIVDLVEHNGAIEIVAQSSADISGQLQADGSTNHAGGTIGIKTVGGDINIENGALLSAKGNGTQADGGSITVFAARNLSLGDKTGSGPLLDVSAGVSGNGGSIDTSATGTVTLGGGIYKASASQGKVGSWTVDPDIVLIDNSGNSIITGGLSWGLDASISFTVAPGGSVNTTNPHGDAGSIRLSAPSINIGGTLDASATGSFAAGDVTLIATSANTAPNGLGGFVSATGGIDISGTIKGANLLFSASSSAVSNYSNTQSGIALSTTGDLTPASLGNGVGVVSGAAHSHVMIHSGANIVASNNVVLNAVTTATADDSAYTVASANNSNPDMPAVVYGKVVGNAVAQIEAGATVNAGGTLTVRAHNTATLAVAAATYSTDSTGPVALTAAYGAADVQSTAQILSGASVTAQNVSVVALNSNSFSVAASNTVWSSGSSGGSSGGGSSNSGGGRVLAFANGLTSTATALEAATLTLATTARTAGTGQLLVEADSLTKKDSVTAASKAETGNGPSSGTIQSASTAATTYLEGAMAGSPATAVMSTDAATPKFGAAMALTLGDAQSASAKIAAATSISANTTTLTAQTVDAGAISAASSAVNIKDVSGNSASPVGLNAGVTVAVRSLSADAEVGSGAIITAPYIGIYANNSLPLNAPLVNEVSALGAASTWASPSSIFTALSSLASTFSSTANFCASIASSCANGSATTPDTGFSGSVNYLSMTNQATAWVGKGAQLTSSISTPTVTKNSWSTALDTGDDASLGQAGTARALAFTSAVAVQAQNSIKTINIGGNFGLGSSDKASGGGSSNYIYSSDTTLSGIGADANVQTNSRLAVLATDDSLVLSISPSGGSGKSITGGGIVAYTSITNSTQASISNAAVISAADVAVSASAAQNLLTVTGSVQKNNPDSIGVATSINEVNANTKAFIGDNSSIDPSLAYTGVAPAAQFTTGSLEIDAASIGQIGAVAVAAGSNSTTSSGSQSSGSQSSGSTSPDTQSRSDAVGSEPSLSATSLRSFLTSAANYLTTKESDSGFGLTISGSVAINQIALNTDSYVSGSSAANPVSISYVAPAYVDPARSAGSFTVEAIRDTYIGTAAGAAALISGKGDSGKGGAAVGGTVAVEISNNQTDAAMSNATVSGFDSVAVQGLSSGQQTNVGVDFAANTSKKGYSNYSAAGSVSLALINDGVSATLLDSTVSAGAATVPGSSVSVVAYDHSNIGIGGGSMYFGGQGGGSVALSYLSLGDPGTSAHANDARIVGSTISKFDTVKVQAINSDVVIIGAATAGGGSGATGFSGALVFDSISRTSNAAIVGDTLGLSNLHVSGNVQVQAAGGDQTDLDHIISQVDGNPAGLSSIDFTGSAAGLSLGAGAAIVDVAGVVQVGKSNVGLSYVQNTVADNLTATISGATIVSTAGKVSVEADNQTTILALSVGVGAASGYLAGVGSATYNKISSGTSAQIDQTGTAPLELTNVDAANVVVKASQSASIQSLAGDVAFATNGSAIGAAIAVNQMGDPTAGAGAAPNVTAAIEGATVTATNVSVSGQSSDTIKTISVAGAVSTSQVGIAGSASTNLSAASVSAEIGSGATVNASDNVAVLAGNSNNVAVVAGAAGVGLGAVGAGLSVVVNEMKNSTSADISGASTVVNASGLVPTDTVVVNSGSLVNQFDPRTVSAPSVAGPSYAETTLAVSGLAVVATTQQTVNTNAVSLAIGSDAAVAVLPVVNILGGTTFAYIDAAAVDTRLKASDPKPAIDVTASSYSYAGNFVGAVSGSAGVSASGAVAVNTLNGVTEAYINSANVGSNVAAVTQNLAGNPDAPVKVPVYGNKLPTVGSVTVNAIAEQDSANIVAGLAGGAAGAGVGSGLVNLFNATTKSYVTGGSVSAQSLQVGATATNGLQALVGAGAAAAGAGVAGSFAASDSTDMTEAYIGNTGAPTILTVAGPLTVNALTNNSYNSIVVSGAGGGSAGIAGMVDVTLMNNRTSATITNTKADGSGDAVPLATAAVTVSANETIAVNAYAGSLALGGGLGVGAGANVIVLKSSVEAAIDGSTIDSNGAVAVTASSTKNIAAVTATLAVGGTAGIGGAAALILIGTGATGDAMSELDQGNSGSLASVNSMTTNASSNAGNDAGLTSAQRSGVTQSGPAFSSSGDSFSTAGGDNVTAFVDQSSKITGATVSVTAQSLISTNNIAGAAGGGAVGVGGAVAYTRIYDHVSAISKGALTASKVNVDAQVSDGHTVLLGGSGITAQTSAYAGGAGIVGLGAAVADSIVDNTVVAQATGTLLGDGSTGSTASIGAHDTSSAGASGIGAAVGAAAVGIVVVDAAKTSTVSASLDPALIGQDVGGNISKTYNQITVAASDSGSVSSRALAAAGGIISGMGAGATATDSATVTAETSGTINLGKGAISIAATDTPDVSATSAGVTVGGAAAGATVALASAAPNVSATVADNTVFQGSGSIAVTATTAPQPNDSAVSASAIAGVGALVGVSATYAGAQDNATVLASLGKDVNLTDAALSVTAVNSTDQSATATGVTVAEFLALGANVSKASSDGSAKAVVKSGLITDSARIADLTIHATETDRNSASTTAGSGGLIAGDAAVASTENTATTTAQLLAGADTGTAGNNTVYGGKFSVDASHVATYSARANSVNASAFGASGSIASNQATATTSASIGPDLTVYAVGAIEGSASNTFNEAAGSGATGAGGGLVNAAAALSSTSVTGSSGFTLGDKVVLHSGLSPNVAPGDISFSASSLVTGADQASLATGGALAGAGVSSSVNANLTNTVITGKSDQLYSYGNIGMGTWTIASPSSSAEVSTYGLAVIGSASATTNVASNQTVTVDTGTMLMAEGNVNLKAGQAPDGSYSTAISPVADAEAYVRGLIAVPNVGVSISASSNATLNLNSGSIIQSGQNTTIGAYQGAIDPSSDATGHGFELGFIPVTTHPSADISTPNSAVVNINGSVTAGIFHSLVITIDDCQNAGIYCSTAKVLESAGSGYAVNPLFVSNFDPQSYIAAQFAGGAAGSSAVLNSSVSATPVGAFFIPDLYASGGVVNVNAGTITGNGSITSFGNPTISVVNNSPDYLILQDAYIPYIPGGKVNFTGGATNAGTVSVSPNIATDLSSITVQQNYVPTNLATVGPALFLMGNLNNLGGLISIFNAKGSLGQTGQDFGQDVKVDVPFGAALIDAPSYSVTGSPYSNWNGAMIWPGGNPSSAAPDAVQAAQYAADYYALNNLHAGSVGAINSALLGDVGTLSGNSYIFLGTNCSWFGCSDVANPVSIGNSSSLNPFWAVQSNSLTAQSNFVSPTFTPGTSTSIYGTAVTVNAAIIDINGQVTAGQPTNWALTLPKTLDAILANDRLSYQSGITSTYLFDIPTGPVVTGVSQISAQYNAKTNQIIVSDVSATSGGGSIVLNGAIMSTTPLGNISVNNGLGTVNVTNQTGLGLVLQNINAGSAATANALTSTVQIIDTLKDSNTLYTYTPGNGLTVYQGATTATVQQLMAGGGASTATNTGSYNPLTNLRWNWELVANLVRTIGYDSTGHVTTQSNWIFDPVTGQPNNPWQYLLPNAQGNGFGSNTSKTPTGMTTTNGNAAMPAFTESVSATVGFEYNPIAFHGCDDGSCHFNFRQTGADYGQWNYNYAKSIQLILANSVKADNQIGISFLGNPTGLVNVTSNSAVTVAGQIVNPSGATTILATGAIQETSAALVQSKDLTLSSGTGNFAAGIGTHNTPFAATLTKGGILNASGGSDGVYLNINSSAISLGQLTAGSAGNWGDLSLSTTGDINANGASLLKGKSISLTSRQGSIGSGSNPAGAINISTNGGVINASAAGDINLLQASGDLLAGSIASTAGNVTVDVANGALLTGSGQTAAQTLSTAQIQSIWSNLYLTGSTASSHAAAVSATSLNNLESALNADYQTYWNLLGNGSVKNGVFSLTAAGLSTYTPIVAAQGGIASPTAAQVQAYANNLYLSTTNAFNNYLGANWSTLADFKTKNSSYSVSSVASTIENTVNADYRSYWNLLNNGTVSAGAYRLNAAGLSYYTPIVAAAEGLAVPTAAQVQAYAQNQYQTALTAFNNFIGAGWSASSDFQTKNNSYSFVVANNSVAATGDAVWTTQQLNNGIPVSALQPSPGVVGNAVASISGKNVNLTASNIGRLADPIYISVSDIKGGTLSNTQLAALAIAVDPGSVIPVDAKGNRVALSDPGLLGFDILQTAPLYLSSVGNLTANSAGVVYVQSAQTPLGVETGLTVNAVTAGGNVSLVAQKNIVGAGSSPTDITITGSGNLVLQAGAGDLGSSAHPLTFQLANGELSSANTSQSAWLQAVGGDMVIGAVYAADSANLSAPNGAIVQDPTVAGVSVRANNISLTAANNIGSSLTAPLIIEELTLTGSVVSDSGATSYLAANSALAGVRATSAGDLNLAGQSDLGASTLTSANGNVLATAAGSLQIGAVTANGTVDLTSGGSMQLTSSHSGATATLSSGGALTVSGQLVSGDAVSLTSSGDMNLGTIQSVNAMTLTTAAGGSQSATSLVATTGAVVDHSGADLSIATIAAGQDITLISNAAMSLGSASSGTGNIDLNSGATLSASSVSSGKAVNVKATKDVNLGVTVAQAGDVNVASDTANVTVAGITDQGSTIINAAGATTINGNVNSTGDIVLTSGATLTENLAAAIASSGGALTAVAANISMGAGSSMAAQDALSLTTTSGAMTLGALRSAKNGVAVSLLSADTISGNGDGQTNITTSGANAQTVLTASGNIGAAELPLAVNTATVQATSHDGGIWINDAIGLSNSKLLASADLQLFTAGNQTGMTLTSVKGNVSDSAKGTLAADSVSAGGNANVASTGAMQLGSVNSTGSAAINAGGTLNLQTMTAGQNIAMTSGSDMTIAGQVQAGGSADISSLAALQFNVIQAAGNVSVASVENQTGARLLSTAGIVTDSSQQNIQVTAIDGALGINVTSAGNLDFVALSSQRAVDLTSTKGNIQIQTLLASNANLNAFDALHAGLIEVSAGASLGAQTTDAAISQTGTSSLQINATGYHDGVAQDTVLSVSATLPVDFNTLYSQNAAIASTSSNVNLADGVVSGVFSLTTPDATVFQNNQSVAARDVNIQLYQPAARFNFKLAGKRIGTDSFVLHYQPGYMVTVGNYDTSHSAASIATEAVSALMDIGYIQAAGLTPSLFSVPPLAGFGAGLPTLPLTISKDGVMNKDGLENAADVVLEISPDTRNSDRTPAVENKLNIVSGIQPESKHVALR